MVDISCSGCSAMLTRFDRYCPACGAPNAASVLHPRFGPVRQPVELEPAFPEPPVAGPDDVQCLRCERPTSGQDSYCRWCGMATEEAVLLAERPATAGVWRAGGPDGTPAYRSLAGLSSAVRPGLWAVALLAGVALALVMLRMTTIDGGEVLGMDRVELAHRSDQLMWLLAGLGALVGVLLLVWFRLAATNLRALAVSDARFAPWMALACWLVPVMNLVLPHLVLEDLWRSSGSTGWPLTRHRRVERTPFSLLLWWPCLALGGLLMALARLTMPPFLDVERSTWRMVLILGGIGTILVVVGALALAVAVGEVRDRQRARATALGPPALDRGRRTADPEPAGDEAVPVPELRQVAGGTTWGRY